MASVVQFENVGLRYGTGTETLADLSFALQPGSFHFLTGPSGAGKTSLLRLLYFAQRPSRGVIRLFGEDAVTMPRGRLPGFRRRIGVVFLFLGARVASLGSELLVGATLGPGCWTALVAIPIAFALLAAVAARWTVVRTLRRTL